MQRLIISLKCVNSNVIISGFHCAWANYYSDKEDESIWKIFAIENQLLDIGFKT